MREFAFYRESNTPTGMVPSLQIALYRQIIEIRDIEGADIRVP